MRFEARVLLHCETMLEANTIPLLEMAVVATCCLTIDLEARMLRAMSAQVGFVVRLEGGRLTEDLVDFLPDYKCAILGLRCLT